MSETKKDPSYLRPILLTLALLGIGGYLFAHIDGNHHKIYLRSAVLMIAVVPAALLNILGRRSVGVLRVCVAGALMTYLMASGKIELATLRQGLSAWPWLLAGLVLTMNQPVMSALRWQALLKRKVGIISYWQCLRVTLVGFFFNICLPGATGGDIFRAYAVTKSTTGKTTESIMTVVIDRLSGLAAIILLAVGALLLNYDFVQKTPELLPVMYFLVGLIVVGAGLLTVLFSRTIYNGLRATPLGRWNFPGRNGMGRAYRALQAYHDSKGTLLLAVGISLLSHIGTVGAGYCFGQAVGLESLGIQQYIMLIPIGLVINAIPITPGGVGQGQTAFAYLFDRAAPHLENAGTMGAGMMTYLHIALFFIAFIGGLVYAAGRHEIDGAFHNAEDFEHNEEDGSVLPEEDA